MSRTDKEALAFGITLAIMMIAGTAIVAIKEHQRNAACAELGGIVVNTQCGRFEIITGAPS